MPGMSLTHPPHTVASRGREFLAGCRDEAPLLLGVIPFGMIYGVLALGVGLPVLEAQAMSAVVFAGSAQLITTRLVGDSAPALVVVLTVFIVNLRHALYSASLAPYLKPLNNGWKALLSYLLTDEAYAVVITRYRRDDEGRIAPPFRHWYVLGAGLTLWLSWQLSTTLGILTTQGLIQFAGEDLIRVYALDFTLALTFIALVVPALKDRAGAAAALSAGVVAVLASGLEYGLGLILAAFGGILVGLLVEANRP